MVDCDHCASNADLPVRISVRGFMHLYLLSISALRQDRFFPGRGGLSIMIGRWPKRNLRGRRQPFAAHPCAAAPTGPATIANRPTDRTPSVNAPTSDIGSGRGPDGWALRPDRECGRHRPEGQIGPGFARKLPPPVGPDRIR